MMAVPVDVFVTVLVGYVVPGRVYCVVCFDS